MGWYPNPAEGRFRWSVKVEFLDGRTLEGTDAADVIERWGRFLAPALGHDPTPAETKALAARFSREFYGARVDAQADQLRDDDFLRHLADAGVLSLIVK